MEYDKKISKEFHFLFLKSSVKVEDMQILMQIGYPIFFVSLARKKITFLQLKYIRSINSRSTKIRVKRDFNQFLVQCPIKGQCARVTHISDQKSLKTLNFNIV